MAMCVTIQMELSFNVEKNKNYIVSSILINKDRETRDKNLVLCLYVLHVFELYEYNPTQTNTEMIVFSLQNFYTVGVMLK
jgi:hypothetical protein